MVFWIILGVVAAVVLLTVLVNGILALLQLRYVANIAPYSIKISCSPKRWMAVGCSPPIGIFVLCS